MDKEQWEIKCDEFFGDILENKKFFSLKDFIRSEKAKSFNEALEAASVAVEKEFDGEGVWAIPKIILSLKRK